jgi:NAD(P)-dependent dehydrogenase (short-subunit alcohol dehydrogenase family)
MKFDKEVAVITGGTTGIGSATCTKLKQEGAIVYNLDIHDISAEGVHFIQCDVRKYEEVKNAIQHILHQEGKIDLLFANAGVHMSGNIEETGVDDFENVLSINLKGMFYTLCANNKRDRLYLQDLTSRSSAKETAPRMDLQKAQSDSLPKARQ